jgi:dihydropteroate synthase
MTMTLSLTDIDNELSKRDIQLDPHGYFIIYLNREDGLICADHYTNAINDKGFAIDPDTGEVIACKGSKPRTATQTFTGRTAKEICVNLLEKNEGIPLSMLDHAGYLGREFMRAEYALKTGENYIQD